jgi:hypothetical protein
MMRSISSLLAGGLALAMLNCAPAVRVNTDYDVSYNFAKARSYAWVSVNDKFGDSTLVGRRIKNAINHELANRGLTETTADENPDFIVAYHTGLHDKSQIVDWGGTWGYGYGPWYTPIYPSYRVENYTEGTLVIDIVDWNSKQMIWRGMGTKVIDPQPKPDPDRVTRNVNDAVARIMAGFPPKPSSK